MIAKTPLYSNHNTLHARMVDFHGWSMPLHYGSQLEEHHAVRQRAGMFDVSHMTIVDILGAGGRQFLRRLLTNDIDRLEHTGRALYTCICNEHGGIIDDLIVYQRAPDNYRLILNSATRESDLRWIRAKSHGFAVGLQERTELAMLAVQGPEALSLLNTVLTPAQIDAISTLAAFECVEVNDWFFARTGYTGEDGLEIVLPATAIGVFWNALIAAGVTPCGLAARDTLRLETGMLLYGQDMDETTTPLESGLEWTIQWTPDDRNFIGRSALLLQKEQGVTRKLVGLMLQEKAIMRSGQQVYSGDKPCGIITSGTYSPTLNCSIAIARVSVETTDPVQVDIRGVFVPVTITSTRFIKKRR